MSTEAESTEVSSIGAESIEGVSTGVAASGHCSRALRPANHIVLLVINV